MGTNRAAARSRESRRVGYIAAVVFNLIMLFVFHNLTDFGIPFITEEFEEVLWALDLSIGVTVFANLMFLVYDPSWFRALMQIVQGAAGFWAVLTLFQVFPFDFETSFLNSAVRLALAVAMIGILIGVVIDLVRLWSSRSEA